MSLRCGGPYTTLYRGRLSATAVEHGTCVTAVGVKLAMGIRAKASSFIRSHPVGLSLAAVFALYLLIRLVNIKAVPIYIDEAIYLKWARDAQQGHLWASLLWDGKPPLHAWLMVPFLGVFKDPLVAGRATSLFFGGLTTAGMFLVGKELRDWKLGALAAALYVVCPFTFWYDRLAIAESVLLTFFVFAIYFAVKAARSVKPFYLVGAGLAAGLALLTKGTALLIFPIVFFAYFIRGPRERALEGRRPLLVWTASVTMSLLLGFGMLNLLRLSPMYAFRSHFVETRTKGVFAALTTPPGQFLRFDLSILGSFIKFLTPALLFIALLGLALGLARKWRPARFLLAWLLVGSTIISLVGKFAWSRFYLVLVPPLLFTSAYLIYEAAAFVARTWSLRTAHRAYRVAPAAAIALCLLLVVTALPVAGELHGMVDARQGDPAFISGRTAGIGMPQAIAFLDRASHRGAINVVVNDYFIQLAIKLYVPGDHSLNVITLTQEYRKGYTGLLEATADKAAHQRPTYLVLDGTGPAPPASWPVRVLEKFEEGGRRRTHLFVLRVSGDSWPAPVPTGNSI